MFLYKASKGLSGIADVDTGLKFLDPTTVKPYNSTKSRYEGTSIRTGRHVEPDQQSPVAASLTRMSDTIGSGTAAAAPTGGPAQTRRAPRPARRAWSLVKRFLTIARGQHHRRHDRCCSSTSG